MLTDDIFKNKKSCPVRNIFRRELISQLGKTKNGLSVVMANAAHQISQAFKSVSPNILLSPPLASSKNYLPCSASLSPRNHDDLSLVKSNPAVLQQVASEKKEDSLSDSSNENQKILINEVMVRSTDGNELERKELETEALAALKFCRVNSAITSRDVQEDVHRIIDSGYFYSCMPMAVDTRDGVKLVFQVEPNPELRGLVCEGATVLPTKFLRDAFSNEYGKVVNRRCLTNMINSVNGWYGRHGQLGLVSGVEILSGGILRLQVNEAEINNISLRFIDRKTGELTKGKTKPETILKHLTIKRGQVYNVGQVKRDVDTLLALGIMEDVSVIPQQAGDTGKVDLIMNVVERPDGGFSAGGGISPRIKNGLLSGLTGSFTYSHRNLFGKNQKLSVSLEKGKIDSIFRLNYTVPWIEGDDKRTSRKITVQNSTTPGNLVHGKQPDNNNHTIDRVTAGIEYSRPLRPKWSGTAGIIFQHVGARDMKGFPIVKDFYGGPLTASGKLNDDMLLAKFESTYADADEHGSSMLVMNVEQGVPVFPGWLLFNRMNAHARKSVVMGPSTFLLSLSGGHMIGNFPPHEAFVIGGINSVRGYEEGALGTGSSYITGSCELSIPMFGPVEGVIFADYGTDLGSGSSVLGNPAGVMRKPGRGHGYGCGIHVASPLGTIRLEYAFNDQHLQRFHFGVGNHS